MNAKTQVLPKKGKCSKGGPYNNNKTQQCNINWQHDEMFTLIRCKHIEYDAQKDIVDPKAHIIYSM
jgi:hypothetical protein